MHADDRSQPLQVENRLQHALDLSFRYLGRRDRTALEVRKQLQKSDVASSVADQAITELERLGFLDDARYAQRFAEDRRALDGWGTERIERRLLDVGVPAELVAAELGCRANSDELKAAVDVLRRRMATPPSDDRERERALGFLARRGYSLELAYDAVRSFERG